MSCKFHFKPLRKRVTNSIILFCKLIQYILRRQLLFGFLLECCHVRGTPKAGQVSRLAMDLLQLASPGLLAELCQDGKVFDEETMDLLLQYCEENLYHQGQQKKNILLAYGKKGINYEL